MTASPPPADDLSPPPSCPDAAAPAPAQALQRLKVAPAEQPLSAAQKKFNRLLARVNSLERQLEQLQQSADALRAPHLQRMDALRQRMAQAQRAMAQLLHARLQRPGLTAAQQRAVRALLRDLVHAVPPSPQPEPEWAALRAAYPRPVPAEPSPEALQQLLDVLSAASGETLELSDLEDAGSPEALIEALAERLHAQDEARRAAAAERRARRKPTARQAEAQAQAQDARSALRGIYRQLASSLHPDREPDPAERERKHALMSQANTAHERGDLLALLRLQLAAEQVDEAAMARLGDARLQSLCLLLQRQVGTLDRELAEAEARLAHELGVQVRAADPRRLLEADLQALQDELQNLAEGMEHDVHALQDDDKALKAWLREQARLAREHERAAREMTGFGFQF